MSRPTFTVTCVYRDVPPSGLSPCPLGSDFQVESIFKSTWKCRSGPIASPTCWEVPHHPRSKIFKTNSRPRGDDVNLPGSCFHFKKLEIPRKQKEENRNLKETGKSNTHFSSSVWKVKVFIANRSDGSLCSLLSSFLDKGKSWTFQTVTHSAAMPHFKTWTSGLIFTKFGMNIKSLGSTP